MKLDEQSRLLEICDWIVIWLFFGELARGIFQGECVIWAMGTRGRVSLDELERSTPWLYSLLYQ